MFYVIDRIEGKTVILISDAGEKIEIQKSEFIGDFSEGDVVFFDTKENLYVLAAQETQNRKEKIRKKMNELWR